MKKLLIVALLVLTVAGTALASGDQNQGTTGEGALSTGSSAQGQASQPRSGR